MSIDKNKLKSSVKNIKFSAPSNIFGDTGEEIQNLSLQDLEEFPQHPFQVLEDESMAELKESIRAHGVVNPILVRAKAQGKYEIIAGHRRSKASQLLGITEIPAIIREMDDEDAVFFMVDTNIQRESLLFSEKAFAYKMKLDALKKKSGRPSKNGVPVEHHFTSHNPQDPIVEQLKTRDILAQSFGESSAQIQRYIRLTQLRPQLLTMVDKKKMPFQTGVELSYLKEEEQNFLLSYISENNQCPSLTQARKLKKTSQQEPLTPAIITGLLQDTEAKSKKISLDGKIKKYFPENTSPKEMETIIIDLLKQWQQQP